MVVKWDELTGEIHCGCCPAVVRNDNVDLHVASKRHLEKLKVATATNMRQASMRTAIVNSKKMTRNTDEDTHLFRVEYLRVLLQVEFLILRHQCTDL